MKKRHIILTIIAVAVLALGAFAFVGCGDGEGGGKIGGKTKLSAPTNITYDVDGGRVTWNTVSHANRYYISVNDGAEQLCYAAYYQFATTEQFTVKVRAEGGSGYTASAATTVTMVPLDAVQDLSVADDGKVTWAPVAGASGYDVYIGNVKTTTVTACEYSDFPEAKATIIAVKPTVVEAGSDIVYYSRLSPTKTVTLLSQVDVTKIKYEDGRITWPAVTGAAKYSITISDTEVVESATTAYDYNAGSTDFDVCVKAIGNHTTTYDGKLSDKRSFVYLQQVANVRVDDGILKWDEVPNAQTYQISNGTNKLATVSTCEYDKLTAGTPYNLTILPLATSENTSYFSMPSVLLNVTILPSPVLSWSGITLDGQEAEAFNWNPVQNAASYNYELTKPDGNKDSNALAGVSFGNAFEQTGEYRLRVKAVAATGSQYSDSKYSPAVIVVRLAAPTVSENNITSFADDLSRGFGVSFEGVQFATSYRLYKGNVSDKTSVNPTFNVPDAGNDLTNSGGNVDYKIQSIGTTSLQAYGNAGERRIILDSLSSATSSEFSVTVLPTPTQDQEPISGTEYMYGTVSGASGYAVDVSGTKFNGGEGVYDLNGLEAGTFTVRVCAKGNGKKILPSAYTVAKDVTRLQQPQNISISVENASDGLLSFDIVENADSYNVIFTDNDVVPVTTGNFPNLKSKIQTGGTTINVVSVANRWKNNRYYMTSPMSMTKTFFKLAAPSALRFTNDQMLWDAPQNGGNVSGIKYRIYDGADDTAFNEVSSARALSLAPFDAGDHAFKIVAVGNGTEYINSDQAAFAEIKKLAVPTLTVDKVAGEYNWYGVTGATNYKLKINGVDVHTASHIENGTGLYKYKPSYNTVSSADGIKVELYAEGDGGNTTVNSQTYEYSQKTKKLTTPAFQYKYSSAYYTPDGKITVNISTTSDNANGYAYSVGGAIGYEGADIEHEFALSAVGSVPIYVYALGGKFDDDEVYYVQSDSAPTRTLTILPTPDATSITINKDGELSWARINTAAKYEVQLEFTDTEGVSYTITYTTLNNTAKIDLNTVLRDEGIAAGYSAVRDIKITVRAVGTLQADTYTSSDSTISSGTSERNYTGLH